MLSASILSLSIMFKTSMSLTPNCDAATSTCTYLCVDGNCEQATINCDDQAPLARCNIECAEDYACDSSKIYCGSVDECNVNLNGIQAMILGQINGTNAKQLTITAEGDEALYGAEIFCPVEETDDIICSVTSEPGSETNSAPLTQAKIHNKHKLKNAEIKCAGTPDLFTVQGMLTLS